MDRRLEHEIAHGREIVGRAGEVWNWDSPAGKLRWARRAAMLIDRISNTEKVLELGCGTGYLTKELVKTGAEVFAIDISASLMEEAKKGIAAANLHFAVDNAYEMSFRDGTFDSVVGSSVLHHLDIRKALAEIGRVLKGGGRIRFTEPNMLNPQIAVEKNIPFLKKALHNTPDETAFFRWEMVKLLRESSFTEIAVTPFDFLHPAVPKGAAPFVDRMGRILEAVPLVREIAGSLLIRAIRE